MVLIIKTDEFAPKVPKMYHKFSAGEGVDLYKILGKTIWQNR